MIIKTNYTFGNSLSIKLSFFRGILPNAAHDVNRIRFNHSNVTVMLESTWKNLRFMRSPIYSDKVPVNSFSLRSSVVRSIIPNISSGIVPFNSCLSRSRKNNSSSSTNSEGMVPPIVPSSIARNSRDASFDISVGSVPLCSINSN